MLANVDTNFIAVLLQCAALLLFASVAAGIGFIISDFVRAATRKQYKRLIYNASAFFCMLVAIVGWVFNPGWIRVIFTFTCIPIFHWIAFMGINLFAASKMEKSKLLRILGPISFLTIAVGYLFLPDFGDVDGPYAFFTLIRNETVAGNLLCVSVLCLFTNIFCLVVQLVEAIRTAIKGKRKTEALVIDTDEIKGDEDNV